MHVLVAGIGWLGRAVAERLVEDGQRVTGVRRRVDAQSVLIAAGIEPVAADLSDPRSVEHLPENVDAVVACQAAGGGDALSYRTAYVDANRTLLAWARESGVRSYVYTSSTGVFGYDDGRDVDEETAVAPITDSASVLVEAEELVRATAGSGPGGRVVRLSGLYGPERYGLVDRVRRGALALGQGDDTWMNFCHRDDAVSIVLAALLRGRPGGVYHGSDAAPARRYEVASWIAERLRMAPHRSVEDSGRIVGGRRAANRRVFSEKTRTELDVELRYPSFREGLDPVL